MIRPRFVTFTGLDARTDLERLRLLAADYPVETGILFSGRTGNRYPDDAVIRSIVDLEDMKLSLHFCGKYSKWLMNPDPNALEQEAIRTRMSKLSGSTNENIRFQVNASRYEDDDVDALREFAEAVGQPVIMQVRGAFPEPIDGITYLHDPSGGRGIVPASHPPQKPEMPLVGYAGGIRPENVLDVIAGLDAHDYYIDMETGVRTNDWFDLDKCEAVCKQIWPELAR